MGLGEIPKTRASQTRTFYSRIAIDLRLQLDYLGENSSDQAYHALSPKE